jgi:hypothetical protein
MGRLDRMFTWDGLLAGIYIAFSEVGIEVN